MGRPALFQRVVCIGIAAVGAALGAAPGLGAPRGQVDLFLRLDAEGRAEVVLQLGFQPPPSLSLARSVGQALSGTLQHARWDTDEETWTLSGRCDDAFRRRGWSVEGQIDPAPLLSVLRPYGIHWLTVNVEHPHAGFSRCPGAQPAAAEAPGSVAYFAPIAVSAAAPPFRLAFGYRGADLLAGFAPLLALLLLPIGLTLAMRRAALRASSADPATVWFRYSRFIRWLTISAVPVWMATTTALGAWRYLDYAPIPNGWAAAGAASAALCLVPPLLALAVCSILSQPVYTRVGGMEWTQSELACQWLWVLGAGVLPLLLAFTAIGLLEDNQPRSGLLCLAAALLCQVVSTGWRRERLGLMPIPITAGELRDRVFALARKAGVKVRHVSVLPSRKGRQANAFARRGSRVLLTDYLLQHMSRREVDAIVAHELAHLKRGDPLRLALAAGAAVALPGGLCFGLTVVPSFSGSPDISQPWAFAAIPAFALGLFGFHFVSRRLEWRADAGAVSLTGDPEALITALARLTRLNRMPIDWGRWDERCLTHPSTLRRVQAIAADSGISPARLQALLELPEAEGERYERPPGVTGERPLFSTAFKHGALIRNGWMLRAVTILTPALAASLAPLANAEGAARAALYLAGLGATLAASLAAANFVPLWGYGSLRRRLRARIEHQEGFSPKAAGGVFVGFAPAPEPRIYEGFFDWDVGYLFILPDRLCYLGEQTRFALRRDQVTAIQLGPGAPGWWRGQRIYLTWTDGETGAGGIFNLRPAEARSMRQLLREASALAKQLHSWKAQPPAPTQIPAPLVNLPAPAVGEATSLAPRALFTARTCLRVLLVTALLAAAAGVLFDLPFDPGQGGAAWYVIAAAAVTALFQWWPYLTYREPDRKAKCLKPPPVPFEI